MCLARFVWTWLDLSRMWLAKILLPDPGSSHFLCACNWSVKISNPEDITSLGNERRPHGWKCVCSAETVNISVIGMIQVIFLKVCLYISCQQLFWEDRQCAWRQPRADPGSVGGARRQGLTSGTEWLGGLRAHWWYSQEVFFANSKVGEMINDHKQIGRSQGKSWVVLPCGLTRTRKSLHCQPPATLLYKPKGRSGKSVRTCVTSDPGNGFIWEAALPSAAGSVPSPLHKRDLDVISDYPNCFHTLPPNP